MTCHNPAFTWRPAFGSYSPCTSCGRLAWDHEQCDPVADVARHYAWYNSGDDGPPPPPVMRPLPGDPQ